MKRSSIKKPYGRCTMCNDEKEKELATKLLCFNHYRLMKAIEYDKKQKAKVDKDWSKRKPIAQRSNSVGSHNRFKLDADWYNGILATAKAVCEECNSPIATMSRVNVSHILSKGSHTGFRNHELNYNILCFKHHDQWEFGDKKAMKIYEQNQLTIQEIKLIKK